MSISNATPITYLKGNGTSGVYSFNFDLKKGEESDLVVLFRQERMPEIQLKNGKDYTLHLNKDGKVGGGITLKEYVPLVVDTLIIYRSTPLEQNVIFENNKNIIPKNVEQIADTSIKIDQEQQIIIDRHENVLEGIHVTFDNVIREVTELKDQAGESAIESKRFAKESKDSAEDSKKYASLSFVYKTEAEVSALASKRYRNQAKNWAIKLDGPVADGEYSSKYWALQSAGSQTRSDIPYAKDGEHGDSLVVSKEGDVYSFARFLSEERYKQLTTNSLTGDLNVMVVNILNKRFLKAGEYGVVSASSITNQEEVFNEEQSFVCPFKNSAFSEFTPLIGFYVTNIGTQNLQDIFGDMWNVFIGKEIQSQETLPLTQKDKKYIFSPFFDLKLSQLKITLTSGSNMGVKLRFKITFFNKDGGELGEAEEVKEGSGDILLSFDLEDIELKKNEIYFLSVDADITSMSGSAHTLFGVYIGKSELLIKANPYQIGISPVYDYGFQPKREFGVVEIFERSQAKNHTKVVTDEFDPVNLYVNSITGTANFSELSIRFFDEDGDYLFVVYPSLDYSDYSPIKKAFKGLFKIEYTFKNIFDDLLSKNAFATSSASMYSQQPVYTLSYLVYGDTIKPLTFETLNYKLPPKTDSLWMRFTITCDEIPSLEISINDSEGDSMTFSSYNKYFTGRVLYLEINVANSELNEEFSIKFEQIDSSKITVSQISLIPTNDAEQLRSVIKNLAFKELLR